MCVLILDEVGNIHSLRDASGKELLQSRPPKAGKAVYLCELKMGATQLLAHCKPLNKSQPEPSSEVKMRANQFAMVIEAILKMCESKNGGCEQQP